MTTYILPNAACWNTLSDSTKELLERAFDDIDERLRELRYCSKNEISVSYSPCFASYSDGKIRVLANNYPCMTVDPSTLDASVTPLGMQYLDDIRGAATIEECIRSLAGFGALFLMLAFHLDICVFPEKKHVGGPFAESFQTKATGNLQIKKCVYPAGSDYLIKEKNKGFAILNCISLKTSLMPATLYPMPNAKTPQAFYSGNTRLLDDNGELDRILSGKGFRRKLGHCYQTVESELQVLSEAGYTQRHSVQFFCGWATNLYTSGWTHHAWLVVDEHSIIDLTAEKIGPLADLCNRANTGEIPETSRDKLASALKQFEKEPHTVGELIHYGKCHGWCYIGVPSSRTEGIDSYNKLLDKYPDHPDYKNVDRATGTNALTRAYYRIGQP